jgi:hypothetical protein
MGATRLGNLDSDAHPFHKRWAAAIVFLVLFAAALVFHPTSAAAQGPPAGLPGVGPVVLEGELDVVYEDYEDDARLLHFLNSDNRRIPLRFAEGDAPDLPTGSRVRVRGNLADGTVTTTSVTTLAVSASRTLGNQPVLVILFNFSNNTAQPFSQASVASVNDTVRNFYLESSYGQTVMTFSVAGWFTIAATDAGCDYYTWATQAEAAATKAGFDLAAYDRRVFAFPRASSCSWTGMGNVGGPRSWINGSYAIRTVAHEQGHNFGNHHSHALKCDSSSCVTVEYGSDRDVMGASGVVGHMNAFQKERLGWLNYGISPATQTVSASGDYWIENYETISGSPKALKIWNSAKANYYYVETRWKMGFDSNVAAGVTVHTGSPTVSNSNYQVDLAPTTSTWDSTLDVGQVFKDDAISLNIQTLSTNVDGALIRVVFGTVPCTRAVPAVSLSPSSQTGGAGSAAQYSVTVTNNNAATCAPSPLTITAGVPGGWSASVSGSGLGSLMPGSSTTATLSVTPPAGSSGSYAFNVTAADGGGYSASAPASLTVLSSLEVAASGAVSVKGNKSVTLTLVVRGASLPVSGASVTVTVKSPSGATTTLSGTTAADGTATLKFSLKPKDPTGTYQVQAVASKSGVTGTATTSVLVQ